MDHATGRLGYDSILKLMESEFYAMPIMQRNN